MKAMERMIRKAQKIQSHAKLEQLVISISEAQMYFFSGFIVNVLNSPINKETDSFGNLPFWVLPLIEKTMNKVDFKGLPLHIPVNEIGECCVEDEWCDILVIPFYGHTNESCYFVLGLDTLRFNLHSQDIEQLGWYWSIIVPYIFVAYKKGCRRVFPHITKRELECMKWASEGKTSWEISQILNISERTANFHLANCIEKTGSINRQQAIVRCLLQGQLLAS